MYDGRNKCTSHKTDAFFQNNILNIIIDSVCFQLLSQLRKNIYFSVKFQIAQ